LLARLAAGGMGEIFLARMEGAAGFEKLFVIKRILPHLADDVRFRDMLIAEARIASMMTHANICQVYELGETDGQLYIVMEYLEGTELLPLLRKRSKEAAPLELGFVGAVIQQATDGLHYAHELKDRSGAYLGIVHRDVTPSNIFLTDAGVVKVLDFGIAKVKNASAHTQTGTVKGKYAYMAPEQLRGGALDRRADVFALGVAVYEMLALRRLFQRKTDYLTFHAVMEQPIIDIRHYRPDCPAPLAHAVARALDRDPANRFDTARQLAVAVLDAISAVRRPWTQGEIGDFIAASFAEEIRLRGAQLSSVVRGGAGRPTDMLFAQPGDTEVHLVEDTEDEFPPVDSAVIETVARDYPVARAIAIAEQPTQLAPEAPAVRAPTASHPAIASNPAIAIGAAPASNPAIAIGAAPASREPVGAAPGSPSVVLVHPRRSLVWPLVALAMVAVAGGALLLVWRQTQNQPPMSLVITDDRDGRGSRGGSNVIVVGADPVEPDHAAQAADAVASAAATPAPQLSTGSGTRRGPDPVTQRGGPARSSPRRAPSDPDFDVVLTKQADAKRCTTAHGNPPPGTRLLITIAPDGRPKSVMITPDNVDATPLGACIKDVFRAATFPRRDAEQELKVNLRPA
jgi:serine/threonine-protein kinase